ncbi:MULTISPECIES: DUF3757 domain-containing protein [Pseudomonas]|uniref:DUF3757 domain-containing protein n=2 Tax=Pseudomonas TaxID=286 RepID=A0ABR6VCR3_9PSED|nr:MULTISPECIES: DUF3757 domain-containing protein [Pseudomonas]AGZ36336.1 hypothetical protein PVLB_17775 [Pseudomonas sp. VLB120]MBC3477923.1 DUF3757 domain-containing protein [Pseudomonas taiwanensis]MBC3492501.1 DUF3757 domain-containing protein [Pseudomonas taiwanensis]MPS99393.1 DUF3757 domain-containing protein [Pseudomonas sp.]QQZ34978.1 DUF3757 domain-containing protein [Pseudomonas sp. SK2]
MRFFAIVGIAGVLAVGNALAATCPEPSSISQKADTQDDMDGIAYSATNEDGQWSGFTPNAKESKADEFKLLNQKETTTSIICRYESDDEGISLALKK